MDRSNAYAVLGATGNCGTALIQNLVTSSQATVHAFCRSKDKLIRLLPQVTLNEKVRVFEGSIDDVQLLASCIGNCQAIFLCVSTNDNIPGCRIAQDTAINVIRALENLRTTNKGRPKPRLVLLSSATLDDHLSRKTPRLLHAVLLMSASHVYKDLREAEAYLRSQQDWVTTVFIKPGALSVDKQRGHALSLSDEDSPVSYLDLAAAMIEAASDETGRYDMRNVGVVNTNGRAKFPAGTPMCVLTGLLRHLFPFLHKWLPLGTGPR